MTPLVTLPPMVEAGLETHDMIVRKENERFRASQFNGFVKQYRCGWGDTPSEAIANLELELMRREKE